MDPENHFREKLLLFYPWRHEHVDLIDGCRSYAEKYQKVKLIVKINEQKYAKHFKELDNAQRCAHEIDNEAFAELAPLTEQVQSEDADEGSIPAEELQFFDPGQCLAHKTYDLALDIGLAPTIANTDIELFAKRLPDNEYRQMVQSLNQKQREFFSHVYHWVKTKEEPLHVFLTGGAGCGKSVVINCLYQALHRYLCSQPGDIFDSCRVLLVAPTGKAAYNIGGSTIHSAFKFQANRNADEYQKPSCDVLNTLQSKYRDLAVLIVDEISMVGNKMFRNLNLRLQDIMQNRKPFGNVHVILVGDLFQLKPVMDGWIFADLKNGTEPLAINTWKEYFTIHELTQIMRQHDDLLFSQILNRMREGLHTNADLSILTERVATLTDAQMTGKLCAFPTVAMVDRYNDAQYDICTSEKIEVEAQDAIIGDFTDDVKKCIREQIKKLSKMSDTANLMCNLKLAVNCRYQTTINIDVEDGMINGSGSVAKKFQFLTESKIPSIVWIQFDDEKVGQLARNKYRAFYTDDVSKTWTPIFAMKRTFFVGRKYAAVARKQFPLTPCAAKTIHKTQGDTVNEIVVDMGDRALYHAHYVAFSRVRNLTGLHILGSDKRNIFTYMDKNGRQKNKILLDDKVTKEMKRLRENCTVTLCYTPMYTVSEDSLKITFQNARSFRLHCKDLIADHNIVSSDIISIAETRLTAKESSDMYAIPGYEIYRNDQKQKSIFRPHHGLATYIKETLHVHQFLHYSDDDFESSYFTIQPPNSTNIMQIVIIYRSPSGLRSAFFQKFRDLCSELDIGRHMPAVLIGDFNIDAQGDSHNNEIERMEKISNCKQHIKTFTTDYHTILDLVFSNCQNIQTWTLASTYSDHHSVFAALKY
jgi:ATP-dependent DNA helicase PIF1